MARKNDIPGLKDLRRRKVVDTSTAKTIGRVKDLRIDLSGPSVDAVVVKGDLDGAIKRSDIIGFGPDAVTVASSAVVQPDESTLPTASDAYGSRLLDESGRHLGKVKDLVMDDDGTIVSVVTDGDPVNRRMLGIGSYAVVVSRS